MGSVVIACIRVYQCCISPLLGRHCRFEPSCSQYAVEAITLHGLPKGALYALWRLLRCQPFCRGGYDPVPAPRRSRNSQEQPPDTTAHASNVQPRQRGGRNTHC